MKKETNWIQLDLDFPQDNDKVNQESAQKRQEDINAQEKETKPAKHKGNKNIPAGEV